MGIYVVRAFVQLRELLSSNKELAKRLDQLEARIEKKLATHDEAIAAMLSAIRELMHPRRQSDAASVLPLTSRKTPKVWYPKGPKGISAAGRTHRRLSDS